MGWLSFFCKASLRDYKSRKAVVRGFFCKASLRDYTSRKAFVEGSLSFL